MAISYPFPRNQAGKNLLYTENLPLTASLAYFGIAKKQSL